MPIPEAAKQMLLKYCPSSKTTARDLLGTTSSSDWKFVILHEQGWFCGSHSIND